MLYDKPQFLITDFNGTTTNNLDHNNNIEQPIALKKYTDVPSKPDHISDYEFMIQTNLAPFPFKVAKALDPTIYRNIEYDTWTEIRKGKF